MTVCEHCGRLRPHRVHICVPAMKFRRLNCDDVADRRPDPNITTCAESIAAAPMPITSFRLPDWWSVAPIWNALVEGKR